MIQSNKEANLGKQAVTEKHPAVGTVFRSVVTDVRESMNQSQHQSAVDIELNFNQVTISQKGIPLFTKKKEQNAMNIKLATRILPSG